MTVCVAGIFERRGVICIADRMFTFGDPNIGEPTTESEPPISKIFSLGKGSLMLYAGDVSYSGTLAAEMEALAERDARQRGNVNDYARYYTVAHAALLRRERDDFLANYGVTMDMLVMAKHELRPGVFRDLWKDIHRIQLPTLQVIIAGYDPEGGVGLYVGTYGRIVPHHNPGFAAIGVGDWHARSALTNPAYHGFANKPAALLRVYGAKRRAEVVAGVGKATDIVLLCPENPDLEALTPDETRTLQDIYDKTWQHQEQEGYVRGLLETCDLLRYPRPGSTPPASPDTSGPRPPEASSDGS